MPRYEPKDWEKEDGLMSIIMQIIAILFPLLLVGIGLYIMFATQWVK